MERQPTLLDYRDEMWDLCDKCVYCGKCECCKILEYLNAKLQDVFEDEEKVKYDFIDDDN